MNQISDILKQNEIIVSLASQLNITNNMLKNTILANGNTTKNESIPNRKASFLTAVTYLANASGPSLTKDFTPEDIKKASEAITDILAEINHRS